MLHGDGYLRLRISWLHIRSIPCNVVGAEVNVGHHHCVLLTTRTYVYARGSFGGACVCVAADKDHRLGFLLSAA